jgi:hypothetical protein
VKTHSNARWLTSSSVRATHSDDGAALLDIRQGICCSLNPVASRIWATIDSSPSGITLDGIVGALATLYPIPCQTLAADTEECLCRLQQLGLVHCNGSCGPTDRRG